MRSYAERIESVISGGRYTLDQRGFHLLGILLLDIGQSAMPCHVVHLAPNQPVRQWSIISVIV